MKKIFMLLMTVITIGSTSSYSQTVVINTGSAGTPEYAVGPVYMSSTLFYKASRYSYLYTSDELSAVGITSGAIINEVGWMKASGNSSLVGGIFRIYMKNSSIPAYSNATEDWTNLIAGSTPVYENPSLLIPATASPSYITFPLSAPFVYTGGSLEISVEWDATGSTGTLATGEFDWVWSTVTDRIYGNGNTTLQSSLSSTFNNTTIDDRRPFIQITYNPGAPCTGATGGTANASQASVCPNTAVSLTVSGSSVGTGLSYQWQSSPDGLVWTDIVGATGPSYTHSMTAPLSFRRRIICDAGPDTAYSSVVSVGVNPFLGCYCTSNATSAANASIRNVTLSNINNTSPTACSQYTDYTSITGLLNKGLTYPVSILVEDCEGTTFGTQGAAIFIDWNQDGDFTDAGEMVYNPSTQPGAATVLFTGNISVPVTAATGVTMMRVINKQATTAIDPCGTYTTGETEDYLVNVQPPPSNEAGILAITKPSVATCDLGQQLWVELQNLGSDTLTSATFALTVNGLSIPVSNPWTGSVPPLSSAEIQVPVNYVFADGDSVLVEVSLPNGSPELPAFNFNNIVARRLYSGLTGNKTVYGLGANYPNMDAAIDDLVLRGVCDTVYFKIASNTYNTQHTFVEYPMAGPGKLAVFESGTGNADDVKFVFSSTADANNFVFLFDGGDGYMLRNLTAINTGTTHSRVVDIRNGANDLSLIGNTLIGDTAAAYVTGDFTKIVVASANASDDHRTTLRNNHIIGGNRGINLGGGSGYETGNVVENNLVEKYNYIGIIVGSLSGFRIEGNEFRPRVDLAQDAYGIYANGTVMGGNIIKNTVTSNRPGSSIYLTNAKGAQNKLLVANNFLYQGDATSGSLTRGITLADLNSTGIVLANNSISLSSDNPSGGAITILDGTQFSVLNNNVGSFGATPAIRVEKSYSVAESDHNNFFGTTVSNVLGTSYATLADHQAGTGWDASSLNVDPGFNGTDLHTCTPELNGAGISLAYVTDDYDGDNRFAVPDIGADEFLGHAAELLVEDAILKCPNEQVTLGNAEQGGTAYAWTPAGNTSQITVSSAGVYVVTATSACGVFTDTAVVTNKPLPTASFTLVSVGLTAAFTNTSNNATSYLWNFGDGNTSTAENPVHVYTSAGTYQVSLTVSNECGSNTYGPLPINVINAGIQENNIGSIGLYPNPTTGIFTLVWDQDNQEGTSIHVYDITGKVLMTKEVYPSVGQVTLDASAFPSGIYTIKLTNGNFVKTVRLIKE